MKKFLKQSGATGGSAQRLAGPDATPKVIEMLSHISAMIEGQPTSAEVTGELAELATPSCYDVSKGRSATSYETPLVATFRVGVTGTRCVSMAPLVSCVAHLVAQGADEGGILADMDTSFDKVSVQIRTTCPRRSPRETAAAR